MARGLRVLVAVYRQRGHVIVDRSVAFHYEHAILRQIPVLAQRSANVLDRVAIDFLVVRCIPLQYPVDGIFQTHLPTTVCLLKDRGPSRRHVIYARPQFAVV